MSQKIETLYIKNFMGIKQLTYTPQTDFIEIRGKNGAGKSSIEKGISLIFASKEDAKLIKNPVRNGEDSAVVSVELTDMTITKSWKNGKSRVQVLSKDGAVYPSPVSLIEGLIGKLPHDPTRLMNQSDKEVMETLLSLIETDVNFGELAEQKRAVFADRTIINRLKKAAEVERNSFDKEYPDAPNEELLISELSNQLTAALATEDRHKQNITLLARNEKLIETKRDIINSLMKEIDDIGRENEGLETSISNYQDPNTEYIKNQIFNAEEINKQVRYMKQKAELVEKYIELKKQSDAKTEELKDINETKAYAIKNSNMPVEGISFDENGLTFNDVPLSQCSSAEQLKVCLGIAVGTHPKTEHRIKVMLLHHGNNLDHDSMEYVKMFCEKHGYQTWIEVVADEPAGTGIFIEGGEIKNE